MTMKLRGNGEKDNRATSCCSHLPTTSKAAEPRQPATAATLLNLTIYRCSEGALVSNQPSKFTYFKMQGLLCCLCQRELCQDPPDLGLECQYTVSWESLAPHQDPATEEVKWAFLTLQMLSVYGGGRCSALSLQEKHQPCSRASNPLPTLAFDPRAFCLTVFFHAQYNGLSLLLLLAKNVNQ